MLQGHTIVYPMLTGHSIRFGSIWILLIHIGILLCWALQKYAYGRHLLDLQPSGAISKYGGWKGTPSCRDTDPHLEEQRSFCCKETPPCLQCPRGIGLYLVQSEFHRYTLECSLRVWHDESDVRTLYISQKYILVYRIVTRRGRNIINWRPSFSQHRGTGREFSYDELSL